MFSYRGMYYVFSSQKNKIVTKTGQRQVYKALIALLIVKLLKTRLHIEIQILRPNDRSYGKNVYNNIFSF